LVEVAAGGLQGALVVHHAQPGPVAELLDQGCGDLAHDVSLLDSAPAPANSSSATSAVPSGFSAASAAAASAAALASASARCCSSPPRHSRPPRRRRPP